MVVNGEPPGHDVPAPIYGSKDPKFTDFIAPGWVRATAAAAAAAFPSTRVQDDHRHLVRTGHRADGR